jgi:hypothetical protein
MSDLLDYPPPAQTPVQKQHPCGYAFHTPTHSMVMLQWGELEPPPINAGKKAGTATAIGLIHLVALICPLASSFCLDLPFFAFPLPNCGFFFNLTSVEVP